MISSTPSSQQAVNSNQPLLDLLARNEEAREVFDRDALVQLLDPANYLGLSGEMVNRVLAQRTANADAKP